MKKIKQFFNILIYILLIIGIVISLTGCGKIKSSASIVKYIKNEYNIDAEVVSVESNNNSKDKNDRYNKVVLTEKDRNITFTVTSSYVPVGMDGSTFWYQESTSDDYYENLTASIENELLNIAEKYEIKLEYIYGMISKVDCYSTHDDKGEQLENIKKALNEIMKLYNLKKEPTSSSISTIIVYINGEYTGYTCNYTANGKEVELIDEAKEWRERWDIPEKLDVDVLEYVNLIYSGECYIVDCNVIPEYQSDYYGEGVTYISYRIRNDDAKIEKEYRFNLDKYREDFKNNKQIDMEVYVKDVLGIVYQ